MISRIPEKGAFARAHNGNNNNNNTRSDEESSREVSAFCGGGCSQSVGGSSLVGFGFAATNTLSLSLSLCRSVEEHTDNLLEYIGHFSPASSSYTSAHF